MRVATVQEAIEGAPAVLYPDGHGGVVCALITDEAVLRVVKAMCDEQGWNEEERQNLYVAVLLALEEFPLWSEEDIDRGHRLVEDDAQVSTESADN